MPRSSRRFLAGPARALTALALAWAVLVGAAAPGWAAEPGASPWQETDQTALRLVSATETTGDAETLRLGLHFRLKPGWHVYWRSPGDAGYPPDPDWTGSENLKSWSLDWPAPLRFSILGLETLGYKDEVVFPMTVTRMDPTEPLRLSGTVRYLTCKDICIPYEAMLAIALPQGPVRPSQFAHLIGRYQAQVPGSGERHGVAIDTAETWTDDAGATWMRVTARAKAPFAAPDLYAEGPPVVGFSKPRVALSPDGMAARLTVKVTGAQYIEAEPKGALAGHELTLTLVDGNRAAERRMTVVPAPAGTATEAVAGAATEAGVPIALILALAVLGGLILNLMPCVLPVLSIKLLGVVGHGGGQTGTVRLSFIASALGILAAFWVLAGVLAALKTAGMTVGWGIQFQQPWFLIAMTLVVVAFACNLWGFFEVHLPRWIADLGEHAGHVHGLGGHFLQGAFATLLATPCSAPFLGTAVGFALARGTAEIMAVFTALGVGLALPFLAVALFPALATRLPRPGPWMVTLRRVLGLALAATGVWLLTVLAGNVGWPATLVVGGLVALGAVSLRLSRAEPGVGGRPALRWLALTALLAFAAPGWLGAGAGPAPRADVGYAPAKGTAAKTLAALWVPFDQAAIPGLVKAGKTVFVDVTADWCLTCQVNKAFVLSRDTVVARLGGAGMVVMQADWTRPDPAIAAYLARYARYGIPFNAVYGPRAPDGIVLPELLTEDAVIAALDAASGATSQTAGKAN